MKNEELIELLYRCYPFLVHAACTIPKDNKEYKEAHELMEKIDPIVHHEVYDILQKNKEEFTQ